MGRENKGRSRLRWIDDIELDWRNLGVRRRTGALDRAERACALRKDKDRLKGLVLKKNKKCRGNAPSSTKFVV